MRMLWPLFIQIIKEFAGKFSRVVLRTHPKLPWMKHREIDLMKDILKEMKPTRVLEWGSGYGTVIFPRELESVEWLAVEHDEDWANKIQNECDTTKAKVVWIPPDNQNWRNRDEDGIPEDFNRYIQEPKKWGLFDLVIIDGRSRTSCLSEAREMLASGGIVFLHDANRQKYLQFSESYTYSVRFKDYRNDAGGVWLGSVNVSFEDHDYTQNYKDLFSVYGKSTLIRILNL